ncbi:MAG: hypothetical protein PHX30_00340 [Candidatus Pacebacteria bacterium]|jgi:peptide subunit release factor 1 (eRF1)|nr:hypothetical protein [Candidatus Paceibacterota bacterium]
MKNNIQIQTLTKDVIEKLTKEKKTKDWAVSFYLGIKGDENFLATANSALSEGEKKIEEGGIFSESERKQIRQAFVEIEKIIRYYRLTDRTQTLVIFFADGGQKEIYKMPVYIPTKMIVERDFYVHPFFKMLGKYPRYCVSFLERDRARIFDLFWGEIEHKEKEIQSEVPQRMNAARATWKGLEERKIQNHIEIHIDRHLQKVARSVEDYMDENRIPYLVIGSRKELIERFKEFLPKRLQRKIVGSYLIRSDQDIQRIKKRSLKVIADFEFEKEREIILQIFDGKDKKIKESVAGVEDVLIALYNYKIRTLVIGKNYQSAGFVCPNDHRILLGEEACPLCSAIGEEVSDITDEIIEEAIMQKMKIVHFQSAHEDFDHFGIGAILK